MLLCQRRGSEREGERKGKGKGEGVRGARREREEGGVSGSHDVARCLKVAEISWLLLQGAGVIIPSSDGFYPVYLFWLDGVFRRQTIVTAIFSDPINDRGNHNDIIDSVEFWLWCEYLSHVSLVSRSPPHSTVSWEINYTCSSHVIGQELCSTSHQYVHFHFHAGLYFSSFTLSRLLWNMYYSLYIVWRFSHWVSSSLYFDSVAMEKTLILTHLNFWKFLYDTGYSLFWWPVLIGS